MTTSLGCVSADGKQATLSPSGAGTVGIFGLKISVNGKREGDLISVGHDISCPFPVCPPQLFPFLSDMVHLH